MPKESRRIGNTPGTPLTYVLGTKVCGEGRTGSLSPPNHPLLFALPGVVRPTPTAATGKAGPAAPEAFRGEGSDRFAFQQRPA